MSRIGNRSLVIPQGVELTLQSLNYLTVSGPKGNLSKQLPTAITINVNPETKTVTTVRPDDSKKHKQLHGTTNAITKWMIIGVTEGFSKKLEINGVGYRANVQGNTLNLSLGYSHPIKYEIPEGIKIEAPKPTILVISGIDKQLVGKVTAEIRQFRPPEPYKGKGIKYEDEIIRRKEGKAAGKGK